MNFILNIFDEGTLLRLKNAICSFSPRDIIDFLAITSLLLLCVFVFRGKKSVAFVLVLAACGIIRILASIFGVVMLSSVFACVIELSPIIFVIIFQNEIREILDKIGKVFNKLRPGLKTSSAEMNNIIDHVCTAVGHMAKENTGAIIAMERHDTFTNFFGPGVVINADVNYLLIKNIFVNKAPLHDGAIVISKGKISRVACFLPLSRQKSFDNAHGSRHSAALGMSEQCDAIVIVVSEEKGLISVANDGRLESGFTPETLRRYLRSSFGIEDKSGS